MGLVGIGWANGLTQKSVNSMSFLCSRRRRLLRLTMMGTTKESALSIMMVRVSLFGSFPWWIVVCRSDLVVIFLALCLCKYRFAPSFR